MRENIKHIFKKLNINEPPVPIEKIAVFFSLKVVYYDKFPNNILRTIIQREDLKAIGVNSNHSVVRQRFSIAHELGHFLLGHDHEHIIDDTFDKPTDKEQEANKFASEILMPSEMLKRDISKDEYDISSLANRYKVSEQAMSIRLLKSGLISKVIPPKK